MNKSSPAILIAAALAVVAGGAFAEDTAALLQETRQQSLPVLPKVVGAMQKAVAEKGVTGAIGVCSEAAPAMLRDIRQKTGWDIRRVSLKARNAATGTPDAWEARQLAEFNIKVAEGSRADQLEVSGIVTDSDGKRTFRYMKALPVGEVCLKCHGPAESQSDELKAVLSHAYPADRATGYSLGQVRGALSVKRPL